VAYLGLQITTVAIIASFTRMISISSAIVGFTVGYLSSRITIFIFIILIIARTHHQNYSVS